MSVLDIFRPRDRRVDKMPDEAIELATGRGDLRRGSEPLARESFAYPSMFGSAFGAYSEGGLIGALNLIGSGKTVSYANIFATQPMVAACVMRMLTWSVRVPLKVYRRTGDDSRVRLRPSEHRLAEAIDSPWDGAGRVQLVMSLLGPLLVHGNGLDQIDEGALGRIRFRPADYRFSEPIRPWRDTIAGWKLDQDDPSTARTVGADTVLHVAWWSPLGPLGTSPLQQLGVTVKIEDAAQRHQAALLANGARPPSAIQASEQFLGLDRDDRNALLLQLREDITSLYAGPENGGRPALLPPGLEWNPVGHTAVEAELIDQRKLAREEACAVYMVPPAMIGILDKANYSNMDAQREMAYTDGLGPPLVLIEEAINSQVVRGLLREDDVYVEFDFAGVLRGDRLKEVQALRESIRGGFLTINEARSALNYPKSDEDEADALWVEDSNLRPLGAPREDTDDPPPPAAPAATE